MIQKAESMLRSNSFLEFRLDHLHTPAHGLTPLKRLLNNNPQVTAIATCRRAAAGGNFRGSVSSELEVLSKAVAAGCQFVDVELQTAEALKRPDYQRLRARCGVILSFHDFKHTRKLDETFERMQSYPADFYTLVTTATCLYDNVLMLRLLQKHADSYPLVGMCMGEQGVLSRVLSLRAGSAFTFASAGEGEETAPGQVSMRELRSTYRIEDLDAATRIYGVAGDPVGHSLSPVMMNTAFRRDITNAVYLPLHAREVDDLLRCVQEIPLRGVSVTMPFKEPVVAHLDNSDPITQKSGACNTLVRMPNGKLYGFNTDAAGLTSALEHRLPLRDAKVLVLGAGGAGRAAVFGLKERGAEVYILNRTPAAAQKLARQAHAKSIKRTDLKHLTFDVIVNATPVGMDNAASPLELKEINSRFVLDMVYQVPETRFTMLARSKGAEVISGVEMFVQQGVRQFEIWTGKPAPVAEMRNAVLSALEQRAAVQRNGNQPSRNGKD
jgi:3-dehydroquinate dehydratase/shikimate dehydrogenase